jgi:hypothetical protein
MVSVFMFLYFFTGQQKNSIDQQVNVSGSAVDKTVSQSSDENKIIQDKNTELDASAMDSGVQTFDGEMDEVVRQAVNKIVNTSSEGLTEVQTENGVLVDLEGRFQSVPVATIGKDGKATIKDYTSKIPDKR